jgi:hypothetical protein
MKIAAIDLSKAAIFYKKEINFLKIVLSIFI